MVIVVVIYLAQQRRTPELGIYIAILYIYFRNPMGNCSALGLDAFWLAMPTALSPEIETVCAADSIMNQVSNQESSE